MSQKNSCKTLIGTHSTMLCSNLITRGVDRSFSEIGNVSGEEEVIKLDKRRGRVHAH